MLLVVLGEMDMIEDMFLAEAVITGTLAAIAELHMGIVGIRFAADAALVVIAFLLLLLLYGTLELHCLTGALIAAALGAIVDFGPDEDDEVQQSQNGDNHTSQIAVKQRSQYLQRKECNVQKGQPLHPDRDDEEQQNLSIGEHGGESQEHGQVHVGGAGHCQVILVCDETDNGHTNHRQKDTAEIVEVEAHRAPALFQCRTDPVIEVQRDEQTEDTAVTGDKDVSDDAPNFAMEQSRQIESQKTDGGVVAEHHQKVDKDIACNDDAHQVGNAKPRMAGAEAV